MAIRVGMVGYHNIAKSHAPAYATTDLGELVAICDRIPERADAGAAANGCRAYHSLAEMLEAEELDAIDVCTGGAENGGWHYEPALEALAAGKHVLVEKPLSNNLDEARELVAFAAEMDCALGCNLNHYFTPPAEALRAKIDAGELGELVYCLHKMGFQGAEPEQHSKPGGFAAGYPYFHLKAFMSHPFSVMRYLCGDIVELQAYCERPGYRRRAGDVMVSIASIHCRFANGAVGYLLSQRGDCSYGYGGWWSIEVSGTRGVGIIENCIEKLEFWRAPRGDEPPEVTDGGSNNFGDTFSRRIHAWLEDLSSGIAPDKVRASGRDALAALEYTFAVIESYESGGAVVRPTPLPPPHE